MNGWEIGVPVQFTVNGVSFEMMPCPAGMFTMGSPAGKLGHRDNEIQHEVMLTRSFLMGKFPVTQELYEAVTGANPSEFKGARKPVECVFWEEADDFCTRLNRLLDGQLPAGYRFALPTEAQWEHACRAGGSGSVGRTARGDLDVTSEEGECPNLDAVAWYDSNSGDGTHEVGQKEPNVWGLYDMHGNVWEWCRDWYEDDYAGDPEFLQGQETGAFRVRRGGGWNGSAECCRAAGRYFYGSSFRYYFLGFRLALVSVQR